MRTPDYSIEIRHVGGSAVARCRNRSITATPERWAAMSDGEIARDLGCLAKEGPRVRSAVAADERSARIVLDCWAWSEPPA